MEFALVLKQHVFDMKLYFLELPTLMKFMVILFMSIIIIFHLYLYSINKKKKSRLIKNNFDSNDHSLLKLTLTSLLTTKKTVKSKRIQITVDSALQRIGKNNQLISLSNALIECLHAVKNQHIYFNKINYKILLENYQILQFWENHLCSNDSVYRHEAFFQMDKLTYKESNHSYLIK